MIPEFPEFKKLELADKKDVEKFTSKFSPYADHNFFGTWSWDIREQMEISILNDNYVIHFSSYDTGERFYTFLGENNVDDTAQKLLDLSKRENVKKGLRLIPEVSVKNMDTNIFTVLEDRDHFDYVYDLEELKNYKGGKFESKRREVSNFFKKHPDTEILVIDLKNIDTQKDIVSLYQKWADNKMQKDPDFNPDLEIIVLKKFFSASHELSLISIGLFVEKKLIAFCIDELKESEYVISHVIKADPLFWGAYSVLMQKSAIILEAEGKKYFNYEQDVGSPSLRLAKNLFRPCFFLKKYLVSYKN